MHGTTVHNRNPPPFVISLIIKNIEVKTARSIREEQHDEVDCGNSRGAGVTAGAGLLGVGEGVNCQVNVLNTKNNKKKPKTQTTQNADTTLLISSRTRARPCFPKRIKFAKVFFHTGRADHRRFFDTRSPFQMHIVVAENKLLYFTCRVHPNRRV